MAFGLNVTYTMKPGKRGAFLQEVAASGLRQAVLAERGCLIYEYFEAVEDERKLLLVERWTDREAQAVHLTQPHMAALAGIKERCVADLLVEKYDL